MKTETVTEYVAKDGTRFKDAILAQAYEDELTKVEPILAIIPDSKVEGGFYVQHNVAFLRTIKRRLWEVVLSKYGKSYPKWKEKDADEVSPFSMVGRVLDDCGGPIANAWGKLMRFNFDNGREYEQPYFALNPNEATKEYFPKKL